MGIANSPIPDESDKIVYLPIVPNESVNSHHTRSRQFNIEINNMADKTRTY